MPTEIIAGFRTPVDLEAADSIFEANMATISSGT